MVLGMARRFCDGHEELAKVVSIGCREWKAEALPDGVSLDGELGMARVAGLRGQVVYRAVGTLFETRATLTPGGDYLLMFPTNVAGSGLEGKIQAGQPWSELRMAIGCHYNGRLEKVNDLVAMRSSDKGETWGEAMPAYDIDYNQHGFIPLIPRGSKRIYCFGTQPVWGEFTNQKGLNENAPIGYRYSDDDGLSWCEARLIRPKNDPVMRMCETEAGTWLLGTHEGDWSYKPLMTRQYLLRSEDRGQSWELLPGHRHGGWHAKGFNRMDEGRPINLGNGNVLLMTRTPEGHLWQSWSEDDGKTWSDFEPSSLIHPDAPPMLFMLSDGKTLAAFHHNRHHDSNYTGLAATKPELMGDRSEMWVSFSTDGGVHWAEPRFVFSNALAPTVGLPFMDHACSYMDAFLDGDEWQLFLPHRWMRALRMRIKERDLLALPTQSDIDGQAKTN